MNPHQTLSAVASLLLCAVLIAGCATTTIDSVGNVPPDAAFDRVYILTGHQSIDTSIVSRIVEGMKAEFDRQFALLGIMSSGQSIVREMEELTLADSTEIDHGAIQNFDPDGLLTIELSRVGWEGRMLPGVRHLRDLMYEVEFTDVNSARTIWRGRVSNSGYGQIGAGWREMGEKTAAQIVDRLVTDGVLTKGHRLDAKPAG